MRPLDSPPWYPMTKPHPECSHAWVEVADPLLKKPKDISMCLGGDSIVTAKAKAPELFGHFPDDATQCVGRVRRCSKCGSYEGRQDPA